MYVDERDFYLAHVLLSSSVCSMHVCFSYHRYLSTLCYLFSDLRWSVVICGIQADRKCLSESQWRLECNLRCITALNYCLLYLTFSTPQFHVRVLSLEDCVVFWTAHDHHYLHYNRHVCSHTVLSHLNVRYNVHVFDKISVVSLTSPSHFTSIVLQIQRSDISISIHVLLTFIFVVAQLAK